jgi:outer membrane receptor protein involved in Fe transport
MRFLPGRPLALPALALAARVAAAQAAPQVPEDAQDVSPPRASAEVNVTAARAPRLLGDTPASVVVLRADDLAVSAAPTADDVLRQATGFALFRRTGSRTANPTTSGVSLRGIGASGAARSAVLDDGLPLNEPFGGWIFWGRVPLRSLERIEVVRGGASELYGSSALSGVVQLIRRSPADRPAADADVSAGTLSTRDAALFASARSGEWAATVSAAAFSTGGYVPVAPEERGAVDSEASSRHSGADLGIERAGRSARLFLRASLYEESRGNGTPLQTNDVHLGQVAAGSELIAGKASITLRGYATSERFHQTFSSIATGRASERLIRLQTVPAGAEGLSAEAALPAGRHLFVAGAEARTARGESREQVPGAAPSSVTAGGRQATGGAFLEDVLSLGEKWTWAAGVRFDAWGNRDGRSVAGSSAGTVETRFADRDETAWSPRLSGLFHASSAITLSASAYGSFRAPTLNELYRSFRVGNVLTTANADLAAERLRGAEGGVAVEPAGAPLRARAVFFWMEVRDAVGNRTLSATPALVSRRRENIGTTRSRGVEIDVDARWKRITVTAGYLFSDATVAAAPGTPELVGARVPQVPRHQGTLQLAWRTGSLTAALQARSGGRQFEDDQNLLRLSSFVAADLFLSAALGAFEPYLSIENIGNSRVETGRTPALTLAAPRSARVGLRVRVGG